MTKHMKEAVEVVESYGYVVTSTRTKKHFVINCHDTNGKNRTFVTGKTPSDMHATKQFARVVRRYAN